MDRFLIEALRMANGLIAIGIVLGFGLAALAVPMPVKIPAAGLFVLGAALGLAVAVLLCGIAAMLLEIYDSQGAASVQAGAGAAAGAGQMAPARGANGAAASAGEEQKDSPASLLPELQDMLQEGRFTDYHIAKAKNYFANHDIKKARYEIGAALAHDPRNEIARALKAEYRRARA